MDDEQALSLLGKIERLREERAAGQLETDGWIVRFLNEERRGLTVGELRELLDEYPDNTQLFAWNELEDQIEFFAPELDPGAVSFNNGPLEPAIVIHLDNDWMH